VVPQTESRSHCCGSLCC